MPFDTLPQNPLVADFDPAELFRQRREAAIAAVLARAPDETGTFDFLDFECGTAACFLGWMARLGHDGWERRERGSRIPTWGRATTGLSAWGADRTFLHAAEYFGLSFDGAAAVFGGEGSTGLYGKSRCNVSARDVADKLRAMPVVLPDRG